MACEESYGFLPCSDSLGGSIFLMCAYGFLLLKGAEYISEGSEHLLGVLSPGVIGGLVLPVLGALPDTLIIIVAGLGDRETAQEEIAVGMGTLAGSTVMLLTIAWGGSVLLGHCDLDEQGRMKNKTLTKPFDLKETGVTCDQPTSKSAILMAISCVLYFGIQGPALFGLYHSRVAASVGAGLCFLCLCAYCTYQLLEPEAQRKKIRAAQKHFHKMYAVGKMAEFTRSFGGLLESDGSLNLATCQKLFDHFDTDSSGTIEKAELHALLTGLAISSESLAMEDTAHWLDDFDLDKDGLIDSSEFVAGLKRWVAEKRVVARQTAGMRPSSDGGHSQAASWLVSLPEEPLLGAADAGGDEEMEGEDEDDAAEPPTAQQIVTKAVALMAAGTLICGFFADPMVAAVNNFSTASGIPSFFVAFVVTPLASNSSELVSSLQFAARKRSKNISLTFSQVYGAVTMNNTLCLGVFLLVIAIQGLSWTYTAEVFTIVASTVVVGAVGYSSTTFRTWVALPVLAIYPLSLIGVYIMDHVLHLDG
mmetsp:Transcript_38807/g.91895  ORF Transcript_38807/g.91895 Transcript_38807/m.91895 type:complete len:533 (+) Transcript_38807:126-1724(+)